MKEGRTFTPSEMETISPVSKTVSKASRTCGACGAIINRHWAKCLACGAGLDSTPEQMPVTPPTDDGHQGPGAYVVALAIPKDCPEKWVRGVASLLAGYLANPQWPSLLDVIPKHWITEFLAEGSRCPIPTAERIDSP